MRLATLVLLAACTPVQVLPVQSRCTIYLRNDGGQTKRPFYAVEVCEGDKPRVLCDSPTPLPTPDCPTPTR